MRRSQREGDDIAGGGADPGGDGGAGASRWQGEAPWTTQQRAASSWWQATTIFHQRWRRNWPR